MCPTTVIGGTLRRPEQLLARLHELPAGDPARVHIRARVIERYLPLAGYCARQFVGRGQPWADLTQVAVIGLIKAVDRYDPAREVPFSGFAVPTVLGELRRHFRDATWAVQVPRRIQEMVQRLTPATEQLTQTLRRAPSATELARELGVGRAEVLAAQCGANAYRPYSLDHLVAGPERPRLGDLIGFPDPGLEAVELRETIRVLLRTLPERERRIIVLRFGLGLSQKQIAADIGLSQMQISRLLARSLARLRVAMVDDSQPGQPPVARPRPVAQPRGAGPASDPAPDRRRPGRSSPGAPDRPGSDAARVRRRLGPRPRASCGS